MATKAKYFFQIQDGIIIGVHNDNIDPNLLPDGGSVKELYTDKDPNRYLGMAAEHIAEENPPFPDPSAIESTIGYKRIKLKELYFELKFTEAIAEDTTALEIEFDAKLIEYNGLKP